MKKLNLPLIILLIILIGSCQQKKTEESTSEAVIEVKSPSLSKVWESDTTLMTAESLIYNADDSILYVSCIGGVPPDAKDGDGFIAKISPTDGSIIDLSWVTGLNGPKGLGIAEGKLYVTDIDEVVEIDISSGEILNSYPVDSANFLNDIDISSEGEVYITDSGTDKVHLLKDGEITTILNESEFGRPNGLLHLGDKMMMSTSGSGNFYQINTSDWTYSIVTDSIFGGDGVELAGEDYLVSSWMGEVYYVTSEGEKTKMIDTKGVANSADIEFVAETSTVFVPTFFGNQVVAYKLNK